MEALHNKGYLHRDLKPDNILVDPLRSTNQVFLIDFGIAVNILDKNN